MCVWVWRIGGDGGDDDDGGCGGGSGGVVVGAVSSESTYIDSGAEGLAWKGVFWVSSYPSM